MARSIKVLAALALAVLAATPLRAGAYGDELGKCLLTTAGEQDRNRLMLWVFAAISSNPAFADMSAIKPKQREALDADVARLFETLLLDRCRNEVRQAVRAEGRDAINESFSRLGAAAMRELMTDPQTAAALQGFITHFTPERWQAFGAEVSADNEMSPPVAK